MSNYPHYKTLDLPKIAEDISVFWKENEVFAQSMARRKNNPSFVFYEGPPSANGMPGIHHVMSRTIKDIFCRYKTAQGFFVARKAGWDTHGLPVELGVEKELNIKKEDIGKTISIEEYNEACKKAVMRYTEKWNELTEKIGYWTDMEHPYVTYEPKYIESVWWLLSQIYQKNRLYKGYTIQPYSPAAGTGLSSHELNQPGCYREVKDTSIVAQFEVKKDEIKKLSEIFGQTIEEKCYFLAWTTTPWTLPSNTALTLGEKITYVLVFTFNPYTFQKQYMILAEATLKTQMPAHFFAVQNPTEVIFENEKKIPYCILGKTLGKSLLGIRYKQLMPYVLPAENSDRAFVVIGGDFVSTESGTGIVHTAPTFGADDMRVAQQNGIPAMLVKDQTGKLVPLVDLQGKFRPEIIDMAGMYVKNEFYPADQVPEKSVDVQIAIRLKSKNLAFKVEKYTHNYPHCWRTDKPILYYPLDSWFVKVSDVREKLVQLNEKINWVPESTGKGRFANWLENALDWNLSRSRFWGIPLPIWRTKDAQHSLCIDSVATLKEACEASVKVGWMKENPLKDFVPNDFSDSNYSLLDLHKPFVDEIVLVAPDGQPMYRENELIDVWFDSGAMPYAQHHFPFSTQNLEKSIFPADFIAEGVDQTRGWFYTLHVIAALCFDEIAYKNVLSNGLVLDKAGQKMSKRLGNTIDPFETLDTYGPDATRFYMLTNALPWDNLRFDTEGIVETQRKFFRALHNTYQFFALYANLDGFSYAEAQIPVEKRPLMDRFILSKLQTLIAQMTQSLDAYDPTTAGRLLEHFVLEQLSNWYVRLERRRFWKGEYNSDKIAAYQTLHEVLEQIAILMAPFAPFYAEQLFLDLQKGKKIIRTDSVHWMNFPIEEKKYLDKNLEQAMELAQNISSTLLSLRKQSKINVRQPLAAVVFAPMHSEIEAQIQTILPLILSETNVKEAVFLNQNDTTFAKQIQAHFKNLGAKYGKLVPQIVTELRKLSPAQILTLEQNQKILLAINHEQIEITSDMVQISTQKIEGFLVGNSNGITLGLNTKLDAALLEEGLIREFINKIQNFRKENDLDVLQKIKIQLLDSCPEKEILTKYQNHWMQEVLADQFIFVSGLTPNLHFNWNEKTLELKIIF